MIDIGPRRLVPLFPVFYGTDARRLEMPDWGSRVEAWGIPGWPF